MEYPTVYGSTSTDYATVQEDNSAILRFTIESDGVRVPKTDIVTAYLSLYDDKTEQVINNRHYINIMDYITDSGTVTSFQMNLVAADNIIVGHGNVTQELHVVVVELTISSGTNELSLRREIGIIVENLPQYKRAVHNLLVVTKTERFLWKVVA